MCFLERVSGVRVKVYTARGLCNDEIKLPTSYLPRLYVGIARIIYLRIRVGTYIIGIIVWIRNFRENEFRLRVLGRKVRSRYPIRVLH